MPFKVRLSTVNKEAYERSKTDMVKSVSGWFRTDGADIALYDYNNDGKISRQEAKRLTRDKSQLIPYVKIAFEGSGSAREAISALAEARGLKPNTKAYNDYMHAAMGDYKLEIETKAHEATKDGASTGRGLAQSKFTLLYNKTKRIKNIAKSYGYPSDSPEYKSFVESAKASYNKYSSKK